MAAITIRNSCGHSGTYNLSGPMAERDRKETWLKTVPCMSCKRDAVTADSIAAKVKELVAKADALSPEKRPAALASLAAQLDAGKGTDEQRAAVSQLLTIAAERGWLAVSVEA